MYIFLTYISYLLFPYKKKMCNWGSTVIGRRVLLSQSSSMEEMSLHLFSTGDLSVKVQIASARHFSVATSEAEYLWCFLNPNPTEHLYLWHVSSNFIHVPSRNMSVLIKYWEHGSSDYTYIRKYWAGSRSLLFYTISAYHHKNCPQKLQIVLYVGHCRKEV